MLGRVRSTTRAASPRSSRASSGRFRPSANPPQDLDASHHSTAVAVHQRVDPALHHPGGSGYPVLTGSRVLLGHPEHGPDIPGHERGLVLAPHVIGHPDGLERRPCHPTPSALTRQPGLAGPALADLVTSSDQTRAL